MFRRVKSLVLVAALLSGFSAVAVTVPVAALSQGQHPVFADFTSDACKGVGQVNGGSGCGGNAGGKVSNLMKDVLNLLSIVVGFAALIMIVISGFRFITANGDSSGIASARSALIYALIGLIIAAMAQVIVRFVLGKLT